MHDSVYSRLQLKLMAALLTVAVLIVPSLPAYALEKATIQLKWLHHFQFAGYYAALEKGFYRDAGLDVTILEGSPSIEVEKYVASGRVDFGVGTSALLLNRAQGQDFVVLGQVFQHSPAIFLTPRKTGIRTVADMAGRRLMYANNHGDMLALLKKNGIDEQQITKVPHHGDPHDLISGKADVMLAYSFNEPLAIEKSGESYLTFSPLALGIDFYGDNFFTTRTLVEKRPKFVQAFREATLRGWHFAMENKAEITDLILAKYSQAKNREWLLFEANQMEPLIQPKLVELGYQSPTRWQHIADTFSELGMLPNKFDPKPIIYVPEPRTNYTPLIAIMLVSAVVITALTWLVLTFRRLNTSLSEQIGERKRAEEALGNSYTLLQTIINTVPMRVFWKDTELRYLGCNTSFANDAGVTCPDELVGKDDFQLVWQDQAEQYRADDRLVMDSGIPKLSFDEQQTSQTGGIIWHRTSKVPLRIKEDKVMAVLGIYEDITEYKQLEIALIKSEQNLQTIIKVSPVPLAINDSHGNITFVNDVFLQTVGYTLDEIPTLEEWWYRAYPDPHYRQKVADSWMKNLEEAKRTSSLFTPMEVTIVCKDDAIRTFICSAASIESGFEENYLVVLFDITARKKAEEEKLLFEQQMQHTQKLESLGVLSGGIAHDFNNILAIIMGYCSLTKMDYETTGQNILEIEKAAERAAALCRQMLAYAGKAQITKSQVNMWTLVDEMVTMLKATLPQNAVIKPDLSTGIPIIEGDTSQLRQVVMNLIINSSEAIGTEQGEITVSLTNITVRADHPEKDYHGKEITPGKYVCLEVTDTGCGMDEETKWRIFEPFYTTKLTGRGLGMSAVLGIINSHNGALQLFSQFGQGTTFKVYLLVPASNSNGNENHNQSNPLVPWQGSGTILLVEDEDQIRQLAKIMLQKFGFTVLEAVNGKEALEVYQKNCAEIRMVLTDMGMPVMDGYALFPALKQLNPRLPIVISSGFGDADVISRIGRDNIAGIISKPYNSIQLRDVLMDVVEGTI